MEEYIYSISGDFPDQSVFPDRLTKEINQVFTSSPSLLYINTTPSQCKIYFDVSLSPEEESDLDDIISIHNGSIVYDADLPVLPDDGETWYDNSTKIRYQWDESRSKWLSVERHNVIFTRSGKAKGINLELNGISNSDIGFELHKNSTLVGIDILSASGDLSKEFQILEGGTSKLTFNLTDGHYQNMDLNIDFTQGSKLKLYATSSGSPAKDVFAYATIAWRYEE